MKNYYFTFGTDHNLIDGTRMHNSWVRVVAENYNLARQIFIEQFSSVYLCATDKWAFQYEEANFKREYFIKGEYLVIE